MKADVEKLLEQHPLLSDGGYGRPKDYWDKHTAWRAALVTPTSIVEIERLCHWIDGNLSPQKSINRRHTSYGLKHIAEREIGYITNGQFIVAALLCGYRMMRPPIWYNPAFNFSESSIKRADQRITRTEENFYTWRNPTPAHPQPAIPGLTCLQPSTVKPSKTPGAVTLTPFTSLTTPCRTGKT